MTSPPGSPGGPKPVIVESSRPATEHSITVSAVQFSGPLPPPQLLAEYERIVPGSADRLIRQMEDQASHRRSIEKVVVDGNVDAQRCGPIYGALIAVVLVVLAAYALYLGQAVVATAIVGGTLASIVGVFVQGSRKADTEAATKREGPTPPAAKAA